MQKYKPLQPSDKIADSRAIINDNLDSVASNFAGTSFPTANLQEGVMCLRTDKNTLYQYIGGSWQVLLTANRGGSARASADFHNSVAASDTRDVNSPPSFYKDCGVYYEFKASSVIGITTAERYCFVLSASQWRDKTGGPVHQIAYVGSDTYKRIGSKDNDTWGNWQKYITSDDKPMTFNQMGAGSGIDADKIQGVSGQQVFMRRGTITEKDYDSRLDSGIWRVNHDGQSQLLAQFNSEGSAASLQLIAHYSDRLWFRVGRDDPATFDGVKWSGNEIWHTGNLSPVALNGDQTITGEKTFNSRINSNPPPGPWTSWNGDRWPALQVSCPDNPSAYMVWRATKWGERHLACMDVHAGGGPSSQVHVSLSVNGGSNNHLWRDNDYIAQGNITAFSDRRLKKNIKPIKGALGRVRQLLGVVFDRKDTGERQTGLIAQDVQKVMPEAVIEVGDKKTLSVAYGNLVGLLVEAIKELEDRVVKLEATAQSESTTP
ncbi:tail fiber domain-containing protein [Chromobacterium sp. ASV23]|uniref:tail fiber domain-containing protein n=1 Tax=Chromobacterium sp. ASV23 TaxID=2795110 RepID=UPI0018EC42D8|nr:tail fiber domain-containing protein [Chromobacterium sp. ASV23]